MLKKACITCTCKANQSYLLFQRKTRLLLLVGLSLFFSSLLFLSVVYNGWHKPPPPPPPSSPSSPFRIGNPYEFNRYSIVNLLDLCHNGSGVNGTDANMITNSFTGSGPDMERLYVSTCYPIEIMTSQGGRSMGHCSDWVQYIYHAHARLSDQYSGETISKKLRNCPNSIYLHGEYPIKEFFIQGITNYWMPNAEQIRHDQASFVPSTHTFLAKTKFTAHALTLYLSRTKMTHPPRIKFMSHSSPDPLMQNNNSVSQHPSRHEYKPILIGHDDDGIQSVSEFGHFFHAYGQSGRKGTRELFECWFQHPEWPQLTVMGRYDDSYAEYKKRADQSSNVKYITTRASMDELRHLQLSHGVHVCPSQMEGFGHYINEARALGRLIVTTNHPPMNEFVEDGVSGILIQPSKTTNEDYMLLGTVVDVVAKPSSQDICSAIQRVLEIPLEKRARMGQDARRRYEEDTATLVSNMEELLLESVKMQVHKPMKKGMSLSEYFKSLGE